VTARAGKTKARARMAGPGAADEIVRRGIRLWRAQKIEHWPLAKLTPYERNPRTHSTEQVSRLAGMIVEFGFTQPLLVDEKYGVLAGHARLEAARQLALPSVPVIRLTHLTEVQKRAMVIADNRIAEDSGWDAELLTLEMRDLKEAGFELGLTGFDPQEIAEILAPEEQSAAVEPPLPRLPSRPTSRRGDLWKCGAHLVLCGDSTEPADVARVMAGQKADAVWTDPPYNVDHEGAAGKMRNDALSEADFARLLAGAMRLLAGAMRLLAGAMRPGAPIYVAHSEAGGGVFRRCFAEAGFKLSSCLIWRKNTLVLSRGDYHWQHEPILYGWKPGAPHKWYGGRDKTTIQEFDAPPFQQVGDDEWQIAVGETSLVVRGRDLTVEPARGTVFLEDRPLHNREHPTMKPVALVQRMLANSTRAGAHVLDGFAGSGSTLIACSALGLHGHLVEIEERYVDVIVGRWQNLTGKQATLAAGGRTFEEVRRARAPRAKVKAGRHGGRAA
jgi:DNA modification methylase